MALSRWDPFDGVMPLRDVMNQLMDESVLRSLRFGFVGRVFPVDVFEMETEFEIDALLPGVRPEDVKLTAVRNLITIHATVKAPRHPEAKADKGVYTRRERYEGEMTRTIELPSEIDAEKVTATYEHGVLTLHAPKVEAAQPKEIPVQITEPVKEPMTPHQAVIRVTRMPGWPQGVLQPGTLSGGRDSSFPSQRRAHHARSN